jgi:uncharacterized OB-fold protein
MTALVDGPSTEALQRYVGRSAAPRREAPLPVNTAMIRHWTDVFGHPSADGSAPAAMLPVWTSRGLDPRPPVTPDAAEPALLAALAEHGFTGVVATQSEHEYVRPLRDGDVLTADSVVESVSGRKVTALGHGHFVTVLTTYRDQDGEAVGRLRLTTLRFAPATKAAPAATGPRPRPSIGPDNEFFWDGVGAGELRIQRCAGCSTLRHPPRPMCPVCTSLEWDVLVAEGEGTLFSFVVAHHPPQPGIPTPYVIALVELDEGVRFLANLVEVEPDDVRVGSRVRLEFRDYDGLRLPQFVPAEKE